MAAQATGAALVGEGDAVAGLAELRAAATTWRALRMPYEVARVEVLLGRACAALGDRTSAALEFDNARQAFTDLGAVPDLERLATLTGAPAADDSILSGREREVLALVAAGRTNREIAAALVISQHTAGRHVENIFTKLGVKTRAAATAYAYEHHLL
jgi:DNA-binding CsgD family transcriptional regulator